MRTLFLVIFALLFTALSFETHAEGAPPVICSVFDGQRAVPFNAVVEPNQKLVIFLENNQVAAKLVGFETPNSWGSIAYEIFSYGERQIELIDVTRMDAPIVVRDGATKMDQLGDFRISLTCRHVNTPDQPK